MGSFNTNFGAMLTITATTWTSVDSYGTSSYTIEMFSDRMMLLQNDMTNTYNPGKWTKVEFHIGLGLRLLPDGLRQATAAAAQHRHVRHLRLPNSASSNGFKHTASPPAAAKREAAKSPAKQTTTAARPYLVGHSCRLRDPVRTSVRSCVIRPTRWHQPRVSTGFLHTRQCTLMPCPRSLIGFGTALWRIRRTGAMRHEDSELLTSRRAAAV